MAHLKNAISQSPTPEIIIRKAYALFPGIRPDIELAFPTKAPKINDSTQHRQLMVFVCGQCNLNCPYCFSHDLARTEISKKDLCDIFSWASREKCDIVTPCGGEPLLYSQIQLFLDLVGQYGMTTYMASNFTVDITSLKGFDNNTIKNIYVHFTDESLNNSTMKQTIDRNIAHCKQNGINMIARANIISTSHKDAEKWIDLTKSKGIKQLNVALTIPSRLRSNRFILPEEFKRYIDVICHIVNYAESSGIALGIAKPLPLCMFPEETAMKLLRYDSNVSLCGIHQSNYMNNLSLSTDLFFSPCLGLSSIRHPFDTSTSWNELTAKFSSGVKRLLNRDVSDDCRYCFLKSRGLCQGFCLSYKYSPNEVF